MDNKRKSKDCTRTKRKLPWLLLTTGVAAVALVSLIVWPGAPITVAGATDIVVYKTAACSCCQKWVAHLEDAGLEVGVINVSTTQHIQARMGVPRELGSCHTAVIGDYWIEGHVPVDLVLRMVSEKPRDIRGLAVPGMVIGSPGMEGPNPSEYDVVAYDSSARTFVYATREGQSGE